MSDLGRILVIMPTYNEAENIGPVIDRLRAAVSDADVLIVDDNSPDGTGQLADDLAGRDGHVHVLHRPEKQGLGAAYIAGFDWGLQAGYGVLIEMDADGSHQPEQLPRLLAALAQADMVKGSRWMRGGSVVNWDKKRELLSRGANIWVQAAMDLPIHDSTGGFNAYRAEILRRIDLASVTSKGYAFQIDMTRRVLEAGGVVAEVPIEFLERASGVSKMGGAIVQEAVLKTLAWGAARRAEQVKLWHQALLAKVAPLADKAKLEADGLLERVDEVKQRAADIKQRLAEHGIGAPAPQPTEADEA